MIFRGSTSPKRAARRRTIGRLKELASTCALSLLFAAAIHLLWSAVVSTGAEIYYSARIYDVTRFGSQNILSVQAKLVDAYVAPHVHRNVATAVGSSFTFGYSFDERYTFTAALNRRQIHSVNVSVIGYTVSGIYQTLCSVQNREIAVDTLIVEIPLINEIGGLARDYPNHRKMECYPIETASLFWMVLWSPRGIAWSHFLFDPYSGSAPYGTANVSKVPNDYFVSPGDFNKIKPDYLANLADLVHKSDQAAQRALFFVTPVFMSGVEKAGANEESVRKQYDLTQQYCRELAGDRCITTDRMLDDPTLFSNITHLNGKGADILADLVASKIHP
jgi:hypothetical protein